MTVGYQWGSSDKDVTLMGGKYAGESIDIESDMDSLFATAEAGYEFNNGISLGMFYKVSEVEFSASDSSGYSDSEKKTNQVWEVTTSYTF